MPSRLPASRRFVAALLVCVSCVLLLWRLDAKYLWQDEAATAVLAVRLLHFGRPLAYDGVNLITNDNFASEDAGSIDQRARSAASAIAYYTKRGDFKADTSWTYQPWGQFVVAAAGLALLGKTTLAARLPFALASLATLCLVYWLGRTYLRSSGVALAAVGLLISNAYWVLHSRQSRYYALSSLLLTATLAAYGRWQWDHARLGALVFVAVAWCWFQVDYGTLWPVVAVLMTAALWNSDGRQRTEAVVASVALLAAIAPFAFYYEMWGRLSVQSGTWSERFLTNLYNINHFVAPAVLIAATGSLLLKRRQMFLQTEARLMLIGCAILVGLACWAPTVAPAGFVRYIMPAMPIGALLVAWTLRRLLERWGSAAVMAGVATVALTPLWSVPLDPLAPRPAWIKPDALMRAELSDMAAEVFGQRPDPNRTVVEWLRQHAQPTDEVVVNYEDVPLMFYLPNPIRGGIAAFRVEEEATSPPRFLVLRQSIGFVHWPVFKRVVQHHRWKAVVTDAPDIAWGNNPDPMGQSQYPVRSGPLLLAQRVQ